MTPKFRAWDKTRNEWSNGFFIYSEGGLYTPNYGFNRKHLKNRTDVYPIVKQERFILMQSTGLFDRDGKEIFEGDVVRILDEKLSKIYYSDGAFCVDILNGGTPLHAFLSEQLEIIGNIYKNPELLEETK